MREGLDQLHDDGCLKQYDKRYVEGYLRQPERLEEVAAIAGSVVRGWEPCTGLHKGGR